MIRTQLDYAGITMKTGEKEKVIAGQAFEPSVELLDDVSFSVTLVLNGKEFVYPLVKIR